jgi:predicted metalloprotease
VAGRPRPSGALALGAVGVTALTFAALAVATALIGDEATATPAGPGVAPTTSAEDARTDGTAPRPGPARGPEPAEITPPTFEPPQEVRLGGSGAVGSGVAGAAAHLRPVGAGSGPVDLRYMRRSDTQARLKRNPLYGTGAMRPAPCRAQRPSTRPTDMYRFLNASTDCLDRAWSGKFAQATAVFLKPRRVFYTRPGRGPCGNYPAAGAAAYYCPSNRGMYIGVSHVIGASGEIDPAANPAVYLSVLAHEYGHHVQTMAGIGGAWWWEVADKSTAARDAHSRRSELQAQCLSGIFARSVRSSMGITAARWQQVLRGDYSRGDDQNGLGLRDHGSGANFAGWLDHGWKHGKVGHCNTWTVPASYVN